MVLVDPPTSAKRAAGIAAGDPKIIPHLTASSPLVISFNPVLTALPPDLGELSRNLVERATQIGFYQTCAKAQGSPQLQQLRPTSHPEAQLLNNTREHGIPIFLPRGMSEEELGASMHHGAHPSSGALGVLFPPRDCQAGPSGACRHFFPGRRPRPTQIVAVPSGRHTIGGTLASSHFLFYLERSEKGHGTQGTRESDVFWKHPPLHHPGGPYFCIS